MKALKKERSISRVQKPVQSGISWTNVTWNPWRGCTKVSKACKNCYIFRCYANKNIDAKIVAKQESQMNKPLGMSIGQKIFTCSMSDFFHKDADKWRDEAWEVIRKTPHHTYLILTKRPERIKDHLPTDWCKEKYGHVWLGVTVEDQKSVERIHILGDIPCSIRWVSFEPLIEAVYLTEDELKKIQWGIIGGESGKKAVVRKSELCWFDSLIFQLKGYGIPVFFKQFGSYYHYDGLKLKDWHGQNYCKNFPSRYKLREYPILNHGEKIINNLKGFKENE